MLGRYRQKSIFWKKTECLFFQIKLFLAITYQPLTTDDNSQGL